MPVQCRGDAVAKRPDWQVAATLAVGRRPDYLAGMDAMDAETARKLRPETEAERQDRLAWEAEGIAQARASLAAGLYVDADEMRAWIESIDTDHELPPPPTRQR